MSLEAILWGLAITLAGTSIWALSALVLRRSFPSVGAQAQRLKEVSEGLFDTAARAPEAVKACLDHGDPVWYSGPNGEKRHESGSMTRLGHLSQVVVSLDGLLPDVAGFYSIGATRRVKALRDTCDRAWRNGRHGWEQDPLDLTRRLARQVAKDARPRFGTWRIVGFTRRQGIIARYDVATGLREAASRSVSAIAATFEHQDPVWFAGPNGEKWQEGDSMTRMYELRRVREDVEGLALRAASFGWAEVTNQARGLISVCVRLEDWQNERRFRDGDVAESELLAEALRDALDAKRISRLLERVEAA
jgi:hypothetical protein